MYIVPIAWLYVALMMSLAEATNGNGTVLGAIITFIGYGVIPVVIITYLMGAPARNKARKAREEAERQDWLARQGAAPESVQPDAGSEPAAGTEPGRIAPMGKVE